MRRALSCNLLTFLLSFLPLTDPYKWAIIKLGETNVFITKRRFSSHKIDDFRQYMGF